MLLIQLLSSGNTFPKREKNFQPICLWLMDFVPNFAAKTEQNLKGTQYNYDNSRSPYSHIVFHRQ